MNVTCTCILFISLDGFIDKARVEEAECKVGDLETLVSHFITCTVPVFISIHGMMRATL